MLLRLVSLLLALAILAGIGYGAWYWWQQENQKPENRKTFSNLSSQVQVMENATGMVYVSAESRADLFFAQGLRHGMHAPSQLLGLRALFKGMRDNRLPQDLASAAELFYYLDLERTAQQSVDLYPPQILEWLRAYAEGLTQGTATQKPWVVEDVLLLHRGLAFFMGRNFAKEFGEGHLLGMAGETPFLQASGYQLGNVSSLLPQSNLSPKVRVLNEGPFFEMVRWLQNRDRMGFTLRAQPFWDFVFMPMELELQGQYRVSGLSLCGIPFLWAGYHKKLSFVLQPIMVDDEQFSHVTQLNQPLAYNASASRANFYGTTPTQGALGQLVDTSVVSAVKGHHFYFWYGMRPSPDLAALFYLLEARTSDDMLSAMQSHQVPAVNLTMMQPQLQAISMEVLPADPQAPMPLDPGKLPMELFPGPFFQTPDAVSDVRGFDFSMQMRTAIAENLFETAPTSALDESLAVVLRDYIDGPLQQTLTNETLEALDGILKAHGDPGRIYFLHMMWRTLIRKVTASLQLDLDSLGASISDTALKRLVLAQIQLQTAGQSTPRRVGLPFTKDVTEAVEKNLKRWNRMSKNEKAFPYTGFNDSEVFPISGAVSRDSFLEHATVGSGPELVAQSRYLMLFGKTFTYWQFPSSWRSTAMTEVTPADEYSNLSVSMLHPQ